MEAAVGDGDEHAMIRAAVGDGDEHAMIRAAVGDGEEHGAAVALGSLGGLKGGKERAKRLSAKRRQEIARRAAIKRWENKAT